MKKYFVSILFVQALAIFAAAAETDVPARGVYSHQPAKRWEAAFVSGNGRQGAMVFGDPTNDTLIANHCRLFAPLGNREIVPDLAQYVPELRRIIRERGYGQAMAFFLAKAREQGYPGIIPTDPFHPGFFVNLKHPADGPVADYVRTENFQTGEVSVRWSDARGAFRRRLFVSRADNVIVCQLTGPGSGRLDCELQFPAVGHALVEHQQQTSSDWVVYHNVYSKGKGGFDSAVRLVTKGGQAQAKGESVQIRGADEVLLLMRIVPWKVPLPKAHSEAWAYSPDNPDFAAGRVGVFQPNPALADSSVVAYRTVSEAAALAPQLKQSLAALPTDYEALLQPHAKMHGELFNRVTLDLHGGAERSLSADALLEVAGREKRLPPALMEKMYDAGRYMFISCAGELPPNLQGIWTGSWTPAWSGDFTLDTNLQLALKHAYSGNLPELMEGYFRMIESFYPEWRLNAQRIYGCRGYFSNPRASNTCLMLHWGDWEGVFWTAGAGWLSHFFYDYAQYTGDDEFLARRTVPLLKEVVAFYRDFAVLNAQTDRYEFLPSYSPESSCGITCTMDVMVLKEALASLISAAKRLHTDQASIPQWEAMLQKLPAYRINADGALAEWIPDGYGEHYRHRHLSHLHAAYEATDDLSPELTPELWKAAQEATRRRINADGEQSSHGRMHMGLSAAHLRLAEEAYGRLAIMATRLSMNPSLMCSHEPQQGIFNVDANGAIPEIVNRMLVASWPGRLELLPALPAAWPSGEVRGILARGQIKIERLQWERAAGRLTLELSSGTDQTLLLRLPAAAVIKSATAKDAQLRPSAAGDNCRELILQARCPARLEVTYGMAKE